MATKQTRNGNGFPGDAGYDESDWDDFKPVVSDSGYKIDLTKTSPFMGTFTGLEMKDIVDQNTGEQKSVALLLFTDTNGENCCMFANYVLDKAFVSGDDLVKVGDRVRITHHGKESLANGQTMNRITVERSTAKASA